MNNKITIKYIATAALIISLLACNSNEKNNTVNQKEKDTTPAPDTAETVYDFELNANSVAAAIVDSNAVPMKIGYINSNEILLLMPEIKAADERLKVFASKLEAELAKKNKEFEEKYLAYAADSSVSKSIMDMRMAELEGMQQRLMQLQYASEQDLQTQKTKEYQPILNKLNKAIETVAMQQNFTHVMDLGSGALVFGLPEYDITESVKKLLRL